MNSPAVCTFCKEGTYSLSPLASAPGASTLAPACLTCPAGLDCYGGADVKQKVIKSTWLAVNGVLHLISCPPGTQLINSTSGTSRGVFSSDVQQCRACAPGQYIIDPDADECQQCPPGTVSPIHCQRLGFIPDFSLFPIACRSGLLRRINSHASCEWQHVSDLRWSLDSDGMPFRLLPECPAVSALPCAVLLHWRRPASHALRVGSVCLARGWVKGGLLCRSVCGGCH